MKRTIFTLCFIALTQIAALAQGTIVSLDYKADKNSCYPGTERNIKVYIPQRYDGKPACLYVGLDGILCNAPKVFDKLIAEEKMPQTIGIFLQPGVIYAASEGEESARKVIRYNRSNEFDFTDGRFAEFLNNEIIPFVERNVKTDGKDVKIKISEDPDDRSIFGLSSGGIAAFNAAWQRPDLFRRVFSGVGTFVSMRGGNDLQMFVRKCEPKPLRVCLQDGTQDVWNATFGHWWEANQMLSTALDFAGYDTKYDWSDCNHGVRRAAEIFEEVMIWLWADYPTTVKAGISQNDFLNKYIYKDSLPLYSLSLSGKQMWQKAEPKEIVKAEPSLFKNNSFETFTVSYPDSSFVVTSDYPFECIASTDDISCNNSPDGNCLWQGIGKNAQSAEYFQRFYWLHSYDNTPVVKGPMAYDSMGNLFCLTNLGIQVLDQNGRVRFILEIPDEVEGALKKENTRYNLNLVIEEGKIILTDSRTFTYSRNFVISPAQPGQTPKSQGQG